jgi:hypothetical protein
LGNNEATSENRDGQTAYLTAENLGFKVTVLANTGSDFSAILRNAVDNARKRGFPLKVEVLPEPIMLNMAIRGGSDKQTCSATKMLMSAVTITTPSLADAIEDFLTSAEQVCMSRDGVHIKRQFVTECKDVFRLKLGADPPANVKPLVIKLCVGAEPVRISARKYAPPQLKFMRDNIREL